MNKKIWLVSMMVLALTLCATVALADVPTRTYNCPTHGVTYNKSCTYEYNNNGTHSVKRTACNEYVTPSPEDCIYAADSGVVTEPTCTEKGYTSYTCLYCGGVYKTDYTDPTGHVWAETATSDGNATCTADGTMSIHCTVCNAVDESTTVDEPDSALGHDWVVTYEWAKDHKSCTATRTCSRGDATETATTEAITKAITDATCTKDGAVVYTATFADTDAADWAKDTTDEVVIAKLGHWYGEWSPVADGTHTANCKRCDNEATVPCTAVEYVKDDNGMAAYFSFCPVCGEMDDGTRMEIVEDAEAEGENLPKGEVIVRSNETFISIGFEYFGSLTQPTEDVTISVPAALLNGCTLNFYAADSAEYEIEYTVEDDVATFTVNFGDANVVLLHMVEA